MRFTHYKPTILYVYIYITNAHLTALTLDDGVLTSHKTKVVTSGSKPTLGFHTPTDDHSRSPRALRYVLHTHSSHLLSVYH